MEDKDKVDKLSINFIYLSIALILSTAIGSFSAYKIATHQPETYEDCVLSNISNVSDSKVSWQIAKSCENKFKVSSTEIPLNKIQELTGFGGQATPYTPIKTISLMLIYITEVIISLLIG